MRRAAFVERFQLARGPRGPSRIDLLDLFGVPTLGGRVSALCRWQISHALAKAARDEPIRLATHVLDAEGRLLIHGGPRSRPVQAAAGTHKVTLAIEMPRAPGSYTLEFEPVVEGRFWAREQGESPLAISIRRLPDGSLVAGFGRRRFEVRAPRPARPFRIPHEMYGVEDSERAVEIPWVLSRWRPSHAWVLDVGYAYAEARYIESLESLRIPHLIGVDLEAVFRGSVLPVCADARALPFREASFDLVLAVSIVEHVGRDNTRYIGDRPWQPDQKGDRRAIASLAELVAPGGMILCTVPFGAFEDHGWFIQYDVGGLERLVAACPLELSELEFYRYEDGWRGPVPPEDMTSCRYGEFGATGVACLAFTARRRTLSRRTRP